MEGAAVIAIREQLRRYETDAYRLGMAVARYGNKPDAQASLHASLIERRETLLAMVEAAVTTAEGQATVIGKGIPEHWL